MGGGINLQTRYWGTSNFQESYISFSNLLETIYTMEINERIPIGIFSNKPDEYTNFHGYSPIFKPGGYVELSKESDVAPDDVCCISDLRYSWVDEYGNLFQDANITYDLFTCDPRTIQVGRSNICDNSMYKFCIQNMDPNLKNKCNVWLRGLFNRQLLESGLISTINNIMIPHCSENINNLNCDIWLSAIRQSGNEVYFNIADNVIRAQVDKSNLKCAFPPKYIIDAQSDLGVSRECWYRECAFTPNYLLLTENIIIKNNCHLTECNINIRNLDIVSTTEMAILCNNHIVAKTSKDDSNTLIQQAENNIFLLTEHNILFILIMIFMSFIFLKSS
ncbi:poxvirus myristoylprotein [Alphaentomopoxvirus acuprea]|uniref:Poxvirus myristoylprotein n=1 Tax=Alphaentomopoxvirus acuprea TaxID=62099 RepID=W6JLB2_9POXV|nr:poxvirus myristoylprotein [Anomala cuprea entomopoxvirus]BAO49416.1 poxvirus myristoylprotein [Anomala cuprea entomopoxvirus]